MKLGALPRRLLTSDEDLLEEFHPHWRTLLPAGALCAVAVALTAGIFTVLDGGAWRAPLAAAAWFGVVVVSGNALVRHVCTVYALTSQRLIWRWGVLRRSGLEIPLEQINTVSFSQGLIERVLRYGDLEVESASVNGTSRLTDIPDPQGFQSRVYAARNAARTSPQQHAPGPGRAYWGALERLAGLYERGLLDEGEFARAKRELLDDEEYSRANRETLRGDGT